VAVLRTALSCVCVLEIEQLFNIYSETAFTAFMKMESQDFFQVPKTSCKSVCVTQHTVQGDVGAELLLQGVCE